jgi:hypothetical protein
MNGQYAKPHRTAEAGISWVNDLLLIQNLKGEQCVQMRENESFQMKDICGFQKSSMCSQYPDPLDGPASNPGDFLKASNSDRELPPGKLKIFEN